MGILIFHTIFITLPTTDGRSSTHWQRQPSLLTGCLRCLGSQHKQIEAGFRPETYFQNTADSQIAASTHSPTDNPDSSLGAASGSDPKPSQSRDSTSRQETLNFNVAGLQLFLPKLSRKNILCFLLNVSHSLSQWSFYSPARQCVWCEVGVPHPFTFSVWMVFARERRGVWVCRSLHSSGHREVAL